MRIRELTAYQVNIPLRKPVAHASYSRTDTDSIIVRCTLEDGTEGWGEGLPRHYVTGETIDDAWKLLETIDYAGQLAGSWTTLNDAVAIIDRFAVPRPPGDDRQIFGNSVRCAIELSLLDAACRSLGLPVTAVVPLLPEVGPLINVQDQVRYGAAFTAMSRWSQITRALKLRYYGFAQAKVKVGVAGVNDRTLMRRLRVLLGSRFDLRIDANEAWTCADLERKLAPLLPYRITAVEQPVPHAEVQQLAGVRPRLGVPIMLDESLCGAIDGQRAIEQGTCDLFNIRLSKCGGFLPSLRLAAQAHAAGLGYQLGCQVGETGILSAAGRAFAASISGIRYLEGSYDRFLVAERLTVEDLTFGWGGYAPRLTGPGWGCTIDRESLRRVTRQERTLVRLA